MKTGNIRWIKLIDCIEKKELIRKWKNEHILLGYLLRIFLNRIQAYPSQSMTVLSSFSTSWDFSLILFNRPKVSLFTPILLCSITLKPSSSMFHSLPNLFNFFSRIDVLIFDSQQVSSIYCNNDKNRCFSSLFDDRHLTLFRSDEQIV